MNNRIQQRQQRGVVLAVSLILLLLLTILAITASTSATLQERMAANAQDANITFQAAEAGIATLNRMMGNPSNLPADDLRTIAYDDRNVRIRIQSSWYIPDGYSLDVEGGGPEVIMYDFTSTSTLDPTATTASQIDDDNAYSRHLQGYRDRIIQ